MTRIRHRVYASLLALGACILIYRTVTMMVEGAFGVLVAWVSALLVLEFVVDSITLVLALRWGASGRERHTAIALRAGAAAAVLHAFRVAIFVLKRTGPWIDFDVRPEQRALHGVRWTWGQVYFASALSVLGIAGVLLIWWYRRRPATKGGEP